MLHKSYQQELNSLCTLKNRSQKCCAKLLNKSLNTSVAKTTSMPESLHRIALSNCIMADISRTTSMTETIRKAEILQKIT